MITVREVTLAEEGIADLAGYHQREMHRISPPGTSFALDLSGLAQPEITILAAYAGDRLAAMGAIRRLDDTQAELKAMRVVPEMARQGAGRAILVALIELAKAEGVSLISLETGTSDAFAAAQGLYASFGFVPGDAFADYQNGPHNQCWHLAL